MLVWMPLRSWAGLSMAYELAKTDHNASVSIAESDLSSAGIRDFSTQSAANGSHHADCHSVSDARAAVAQTVLQPSTDASNFASDHTGHCTTCLLCHGPALAVTVPTAAAVLARFPTPAPQTTVFASVAIRPLLDPPIG